MEIKNSEYTIFLFDRKNFLVIYVKLYKLELTLFLLVIFYII